jgi:hypothetical protein
MALPAPHSILTAHVSQLRLVFVDRQGDGSKGIIVFWQRPKVIDGTSTAWVHAPISSEFVCLLREEVTRSQARPAEAFECVQAPPGVRGGDAPLLDPRTGAHHILIPRLVDHLQGVVTAMLRVLRAHWTVCKGAAIPENLFDLYPVGSCMERRRKLPGTGGARASAFVESTVGGGSKVGRVVHCTWAVWGSSERCTLCKGLHGLMKTVASRKRAASAVELDCDSNPADNVEPSVERPKVVVGTSGADTSPGPSSGNKRLRRSEDSPDVDDSGGSAPTPHAHDEDDFAYLEQRHTKSLLKLEALKVGVVLLRRLCGQGCPLICCAQ